MTVGVSFVVLAYSPSARFCVVIVITVRGQLVVHVDVLFFGVCLCDYNILDTSGVEKKVALFTLA